MKLVDSLAEQAILESVIEATKPPLPPDVLHLHYLMATPFRYGAIYPRGSRFRRAGQTPGVYYGSRTAATAVTEMAFHRLLFFAESPGTPWPTNPGEFTVFAAEISTRHALDLRHPPFVAHRALWIHPTDYTACQALADTARAAGVDLLSYESARDPDHGVNLALLNGRPFRSAGPTERQTWRLDLGPAGVRAVCAFPEAQLEFGRQAFAADPRIASFAWQRGQP